MGSSREKSSPSEALRPSETCNTSGGQRAAGGMTLVVKNPRLRRLSDRRRHVRPPEASEPLEA
jgi:hypothetical protein